MNDIKIGNLEEISKDFVPARYQVKKDDLYFMRNRQSNSTKFRSLNSKEMEILVKNNNTAESWDKVLVSNDFDASLVRNCEFWGLVRIGELTHSYLEFHKLRMPVGINNCTIISCDIGDNVVMRNVHFLSHYIIGNNCILFNIDEMITADNAKFGNGIVKDGENEDVRTWLELANENGGRSILPFVGILPADAYIWSRYREDDVLLQRFIHMTDKLGDTRRGYYGLVKHRTVIKDCNIIKSTNIGSDCYIKGANKLKNLTINSSADEPTQIGEGVELVNGIVGFSNSIFYGVKAVRFITGRNAQLKYGARLLNSFLGPNSTISCCEVLNNLIFPFHEQHHNNSFLIASTVMGQSNIAAGATIGSNHNSRAADGEVIAQRGFWPGLMSNFKHNSVFAPFTLVAKGTYHSEMNINLSFALVSPGDELNTIQLFPGFWFKYNMYALARNAWKFGRRDKRKIKEQHIETDYLAPDTVEAMFESISILQSAIQEAVGKKLSLDEIENDKTLDHKYTIELDHVYNKGKAKVLKPAQGIMLYRKMIRYYGSRELANAVKQVLNDKNYTGSIAQAIRSHFNEPVREWDNIGGQLIPVNDLSQLINDIKNEKISSWPELHLRYDQHWKSYPELRKNHGIQSVLAVDGLTINDLDNDLIVKILEESQHTAQQLLDWAFESRKKDYTNEYRKATYRNDAEMNAVLGPIDKNSFLIDFKQSSEMFISEINDLLKHVKN